MTKQSKDDIIKGVLFAELLNQNGVKTGVDMDKIYDKITGETMKECECECECARISTKRIYTILLKVQEMILQNNIDKKEIISLLSSIEHDILLLNDKDNSIERDLFQ